MKEVAGGVLGTGSGHDDNGLRRFGDMAKVVDVAMGKWGVKLEVQMGV